MTHTFNLKELERLSIADIISLKSDVSDHIKTLNKKLQYYGNGEGGLSEKVSAELSRYKFIKAVLKEQIKIRTDLIFPLSITNHG